MPGYPGILDSLTAEQHDQLITWIETIPIKEVLDHLAAPPPDGFGIKTHITSLRRFYQRHRSREARDDLALARTGHLNGEHIDILKGAASSAMAQQLFRIVSAPALHARDLPFAARCLLSLNGQQLHRDQLTLARERLELERQKLRLAAVFQQVKCTNSNDEQKIQNALDAPIR